MAYGNPANVRSHRRGGRRRRRRVAPWISVTLVSMVVLAGLGFGYQLLLAQTCSGLQTARIVASPSTANLLDSFATEWSNTEPATEDGTCARVVVAAMDSAEVANRLAAGWNREAGEPPHVWIPASTAWAQKAAASDIANPMIPDLRPSIARTPTVIAMPEPMAAELNWPDTQVEPDSNVRWESLLEVFADGQGWAQFGKEEWGEFRFGMSDPARDTAGLLALTAILDSDQSGDTSDPELRNLFQLYQLLEPEIYHETTEQLLNALSEVDDEKGEEATLRHVSAFPALEQDVLDYNRSNPQVRLAAVYPINGNIEADHPYLILNADWVDESTRAVAEEFLSYLRSDAAQQKLREAGFRGSRYREPGAQMVQSNGLVPELVALPRAVLVPDAVTVAIDRWTALTRRSNVLIAFDVSGSMLREIPGTGEIRMTRATQAAADTVSLFTDDDQAGFWEFSTDLDGEVDYRSLVSIGALADVMEDNRTRREHILDAIAGLAAATDTGLYNTIQAAYDTVLANYEPDATNMVVVITDGEDDTQGRPGISLNDLLDHLESAAGEDQEVQVVTVSFGDEPDFEIMRQISTVTGGQAYYSRDGFDLVDVLRTAVFGGAS